MTEQLVTFHYNGSYCYAFLGVHAIGVASETGKWMSTLDGIGNWRGSSGGDLAGAKAAIVAHARDWYEAAHQRLAEGQADRILGEVKRRPKQQQATAVRIKEIEPQAVAVRLMRDGVLTTYVLPPSPEASADKSAGPAKVTLEQARMYCVSACEVAENKLRAMPADQLAAHELGVFAGMLRLIDGCSSSGIIKAELKKIALVRAQAEARALDEQKTGVTEETCPGHVASETDPGICARCGVHIGSLRPSNDADQGAAA